MGELREIGDIQINEDIAFLEREWQVQRFGWIGFGLLLILGLLGVFGRGMVAHDYAGNRQTLGLEFDRIVRHGSIVELTIDVGPGLQPDSTLRIAISRDYLRHFEIQNIMPEPAGSGDAGDMVFYEFTRADVRRPSRIMFQLIPNSYWHKRGSLALAGATTLEFSQFILP